jgi:hypothetical protein
MSLDKSSLADALFDVYDAMIDGEKDDSFYAEGVANAISDYLNDGDAEIAAWAGIFMPPATAPGAPAKGEGNPMTQGALAQPMILSVCNDAMTDLLLATQIGLGTGAMLALPITLQISGGTGVVPGSPPTMAPVTGTGTGLIPVAAALGAALGPKLADVYSQMEDGEKDERWMADNEADAIHSVIANAPVLGTAMPPITGAPGNGMLS